MEKHGNRLIGESSPYLRQHAHNPVDWYPWGDEAFRRAKQENKLVLVSIGYSSCHWCHVMEHESFEDPEVARPMNDRFICIKVDREERPDIDQVYMGAVQLMTGRGGWPLNCFTLPDGRPVYGGTYFAPDQWTQVLRQLADTWAQDPAKVEAYAARLHDQVRQTELVALNPAPASFTRAQVDQVAAGLARDFDGSWGGPEGAPKFAMPTTYEFLLRYAATTRSKAIGQHVRLTLDKMVQGGLFDQAGGGFARYSTDPRWKVPHFEKMLYDNAQLISLYSHAFQAYHDEEYRRAAERTIAWAVREMRSPEGAFYSALDADSDGEEGRFYTWTMAELATVLGSDLGFATEYYHAGTEGHWEHGRNILLRLENDAAYAQRTGMDPGALRNSVDRVNAKLLSARAARNRPGLDDKAITSWNALMVTALCAAHEAFDHSGHLHMAERAMQQILSNCRRSDGGLWHCFKEGRATINGYLEDYSFTIEALLALYGSTFEERWLAEAHALARYAIGHFRDDRSGMFWFTSKLDPPLITRSMEVYDNVIPASNSSMAKGLSTLGQLFGDPAMADMARQQLHIVMASMAEHPGGHGNWAQLLMDLVHPRYQVAITGPQALERRRDFGGHFTPGCLFMGTTGTSTLPLLADKPADGTTKIQVCEGQVCQLPVATVDEALQLLQ